MSENRLSNLIKDLSKAKQQALLIEVMKSDLESWIDQGSDLFKTVCDTSAAVFDVGVKGNKTNVLMVGEPEDQKPSSIFGALLNSLDNEFDDLHKREILNKLTGFGLGQALGGGVGDTVGESLNVGAEKMMDYLAEWTGGASDFMASAFETTIETAAEQSGDLLETVGEKGAEAVTGQFSTNDEIYLSRPGRKRLKELAPRLSKEATNHEALQLALEMLLVTAEGAPKVIVVKDPLRLDDASLALLAMLVALEKDLRQVNHTEEPEQGRPQTACISVVLTFTGPQPHDTVEDKKIEEKQRAVSRLRMMASRYSLLERLDSDIPVPAVRASTFVGREAELNSLWQDWKTVFEQSNASTSEPAGSSVPKQTWALIKGEPGTGKTALANRFIQQVRSDTNNPACLSIPTLRMLNQTGHSAQATGLASLKNSIVDELRRLNLIYDENVGWFARSRRKVEESAESLVTDARSEDPEAKKRVRGTLGKMISRLVGVDAAIEVARSAKDWSKQDEMRSLRQEEFGQSSQASNKEDQYELLRLALSEIRTLARKCTPKVEDKLSESTSPVLLLIDDLQWVDDFTAEFLLNEWPADMPVYIIATARGSDSFTAVMESGPYQAANPYRNRLFAELGLVDTAPARSGQESEEATEQEKAKAEQAKKPATTLSLASHLNLKGMDQPMLANLVRLTYADITQEQAKHFAAGVIKNLSGENNSSEVITLFAIETLNVISDSHFYQRNPQLPRMIEPRGTDHYFFKMPENIGLAEALDKLFKTLTDAYQASYLAEAGQGSSGARFNLASYAVLEERLHLIEQHFGEYGGTARYSLLFSALLGSPFQSGLVQHVIKGLKALPPEDHGVLAPFLNEMRSKANGSLGPAQYETLERAYEIIRRLEESTQSTDRYVYQHGLLQQFLLGQFTQALERVYPSVKVLKAGLELLTEHLLSIGNNWFEINIGRKASEGVGDGLLRCELERKIFVAELKGYRHHILLRKGHGHGDWSIAYVEALSDLVVIYGEVGRWQQARSLASDAHSIAAKGYKESPERWGHLYAALWRQRAILELSRSRSVGSFDTVISRAHGLGYSEEVEDVLYRVIWLLDNAIEVAEAQKISSDELRFRDARLMTEIGTKLRFSWEKILSEYEKASQACQRLCLSSSQHWQVHYAENLSDISWVYSELGRFEEALITSNEATSICQQGYHLSPDQWVKAYSKSLRVAAICHQRIGSNEKALELSHEALAIVKSRYLESSERWAESYLSSVLCRADIYFYLKQSDKVLSNYMEAISIFRYRYKVAPEEWTEAYLQSLSDIALIFRKLELQEEALLLYEESLPILEIFSKKLPKRWASVYADNLHNFAICYDELGRKDEALPFFDKELSVRRVVYKAEPNVLADILNKRALYHLSLRPIGYWLPLFNEALSLHRQGYAVAPVNWINNYTNTLNNLAAAYENLQASERSLPLYQEAVRIWSQCYESDAESSVVGYSDSLNNLAITYKKFGCPAKTVPLYQKSVEIWYKAYESAQEKKSRLESLYAEQTIASNNLLTNMQSIITSDIEKALEGYASSLNDLAMTYVEQGRPTEALSLLEKALSIHLEGYESAPERWANDYANSLGNLARTLEDTQELSRALEIWQEAKELTVKHSRLPEEVWLQLRVEAMIMSARLLRMLERFSEALSELDTSEALLVEMDDAEHAERHSSRAWSLTVRAKILIQAGDVSAAKALVPKLEQLIRDHGLQDLADGLDSIRDDIQSAEKPGG